MDRQRSLLCALTALFTPVAALLFRLELSPWFSNQGMYAPFIVPITLSAWCGGLWPGTVSLLISTILCYLYLIPAHDLKLLPIFFLFNLPIIGFSEAMHRALRRLVRQKEQLEAADREKDRMMALLVHELRNPLSGMSNAMRLIRMGGTAGKDTTHYQDIADRSLQQMGRLIDDLMDVSRIARGRVQLRYQSFDLLEVIHTLLPALVEQGERKGVRVALVAPEPVTLFGDPMRVSQVISNLVGNALKFTDRGQVTITVTTEGGTACLKVCDTGVGIPAHILPTIWEPFRQGTVVENRGGLGLGLSVVKGLVEIHGGKVSVTSEDGKGSCFMVELPLEEGLVGRKGGRRAEASGTNDTETTPATKNNRGI